MSTTLQTVLNMTRDALNEAVPRYWSDVELLRYMNRGIRDAWRQITLTNQNYQFSLNTSVTLAANADVLTNVPTDVSVIFNLESLDMVAHPINFIGRTDYANAEFQNARRRSQAGETHNPDQPGTIFFCLVGAGAPVGAPTVYVAPRVSAALTLALAYRPVIGAELTATGLVPLPGELDQALVHWTAAYAIGRERSSAEPDAPRISLYQREVDVILAAITPRDEQEDQTVQAFFQEYW